MKVVFLEDVPGTADAGEVKQVKNGFARNYLLPNNLAAPATATALQGIRRIQEAAQDTRLKISEDARVVAKALEGQHVTIEVRVGPSGRLFGSVTSRNIAEELTKLTGREVDHRSIMLGESIHDAGDYDIPIRVYREVTATVKVSVIPEGYLEEQAQRAAAGVGTEESSDEPAAAVHEAEADEEAPVSAEAEKEKS